MKTQKTDISALKAFIVENILNEDVFDDQFNQIFQKLRNDVKSMQAAIKQLLIVAQRSGDVTQEEKANMLFDLLHEINAKINE